MIAFDHEHQEIIFPVDNSQLRNGDLILIKSGEQVPADCKILWGNASVNEAIITGESMPLEKHAKDRLIGGSIITYVGWTGNCRINVISNSYGKACASYVARPVF